MTNVDADMRKIPLRIVLETQGGGDADAFDLVVHVENTHDRVVHGLNLLWRFDYDDPLGERLVRKHTVAEFIQIGEGPLLPGESRQFVYPGKDLPALLSVVDALSPERYSLQIKFDDTIETAMTGSSFGAWVQRNMG